MNETTKITESVRKKVLEIMELAMLINDSPTEQELTGNKPTIFVEFSGHIATMDVHIAPNGWFDDITTDETEFYNFCLTENENIEAELFIPMFLTVMKEISASELFRIHKSVKHMKDRTESVRSATNTMSLHKCMEIISSPGIPAERPFRIICRCFVGIVI